jgi:hypothetical protein
MSKIIDYRIIEPCMFGYFTECVKELYNDGYNIEKLGICDSNEDYLSSQQLVTGNYLELNLNFIPVRAMSQYYVPEDYGYEPNFYGAFIKHDDCVFDKYRGSIESIAFAWHDGEIHIDTWLNYGEEPKYESIVDLLNDDFYVEEKLLSISRYGKDQKGDFYSPKKTKIGQIFIRNTLTR